MYVMNKLKENQIRVTKICSSFYKNVSLLTTMISPSFEFQQHFKEGMFDKPNTTGFLYVSHYLSTIYDVKLFKQMVRWPILCKRDEVTYRIEIKNFLYLLSRDNPDFHFPPIQMSHLIQSAGSKFQIIMWRLSQLALRAYIQRECIFQEELLNMPCTGLAQDLAKAYFNNIIVNKCNIILKTCEKTEQILDATNNFLNDEMKTLNAYKSEIFDRKENIKGLVLDLSIYPLIQEQLIDVDDFSIIDVWKRSISKKVQYVHRKNKELNKLEESCNCLYKLVLRINSNSETLDANKFPKIYCYNYYLLYTQFETQHLIRNLHANDSVVFSTLLSLLYLTFKQILHRKNITSLSDLSQCLPFVQNACERMESLQMLFSALNAKLSNMCKNEEYVSLEINNIENYSDFNASNVSIANRNISLQPPKIIFNFNQHTDDDLFYEKLSSSPVEGKHKYLFNRYQREYRSLCELPTTLLDFSNSWNNMSGWLSPRAHSIKCEQISFKGTPLSPLYSRLLRYSKLDLNCSRERVLHSSNANYEGLNLTPRKRPSRMGYLNSCGRRIKHVF
ncbi:uncharacterized protein LOC105832514 isoform X2 [Monomorium pharaonis]|uniref:uncharacterized protein LOC105832514 isoform X2 n=1 Tax=Monomorium pharaonis TaxID=307658 RepID=UPI00063ED889|nr:uncharacterized protein LOC105832514 isoform X2 [Monomorium pharaonis]